VLDQPLEAEIELLSVDSGDLEGLVVQLGTAEEFRQLGVERSFSLTNIEFEIVRRKNNTAYIKLTTTAPFSEPFLNVVVKAIWPNGSVLREFTALIDPPNFALEPPAPVKLAEKTKPGASTTPAKTTPLPAITPADITAPAPVDQQQATDRKRVERRSVEQNANALSYGPVRPNDTLFVIANQMRPEGVTVNQMMLALVRENPGAFYNNNINQLKTEYTLRIEDPATISTMSAADATAEVNRQYAEWRAGKTDNITGEAEQAAVEGVTREDSVPTGSSAGEPRLTLLSPDSASEKSEAEEIEQLRDDLSFAVEALNASRQDATEIVQLREDFLVTVEALKASRQEIVELKARVAEMEKKYQSMVQQILSKEEELLTLRKQLSLQSTAAPAEGLPVPASDSDMLVDVASGAPAPASESERDPGLLRNPLFLYGVIGLLILVLAAALIRRNRRIQSNVNTQMFSGNSMVLDKHAEAMQKDNEESSKPDPDKLFSVNAAQDGETKIDPVTEAEIYLAYGENRLAEAILQRALEKEPGNNQLKLKLLEVYFASKNSEAFEQHAGEFHAALVDEKGPSWKKVLIMGSQLCPHSPLFGGTSRTEPVQEEANIESDKDNSASSEIGSGSPKETGTANTSEGTSAKTESNSKMDISSLGASINEEDPDTESSTVARLWQERQNKDQT
jgi:pilus assembly protein FimV